MTIVIIFARFVIYSRLKISPVDEAAAGEAIGDASSLACLGPAGTCSAAARSKMWVRDCKVVITLS